MDTMAKKKEDTIVRKKDIIMRRINEEEKMTSMQMKEKHLKMMMTRIITADAVGNSPEPSDGEDKEEDDDSESDDDSDYEDAPTTVIHICIKNKRTKQDETFKALLDTGASNCLGTKAALQRAGLIQQLDKHPRRYGTAAGKFATSYILVIDDCGCVYRMGGDYPYYQQGTRNNPRFGRTRMVEKIS